MNGHELKQLRQKNGLTVKDLALKLGYGPNRIYNWEKSKHEIDQFYVKRITAAFDPLVGSRTNWASVNSKLNIDVLVDILQKLKELKKLVDSLGKDEAKLLVKSILEDFK